MGLAAYFLCFVALAFTASAALSSSSEDKINFLLQRVQQLEIKDVAHQSEIQDLKTKLASIDTTFSKKTADMMTEIAQCKASIQTQTNQSAVVDGHRAPALTQVAFYAIASQHTVDNIRTGQHIVFDTVFTNTGNAYRPSDGTFIAPVGGTYVFSVVISGRKSGGLTSYFVVNVNDYMRGKLISHTLQQNSQFLILTLRAGDSVYTTTQEDNNGILGVYYSTFSGFLLYE